MADPVPVKFTAHHQSYNAGEVAAFAPDYAQMLIDAGVATEVVADKQAPRTRTKPAPEPVSATEAEPAPVAPVEPDAPVVETKAV